jgi:antitoxin ParD1/3/4
MNVSLRPELAKYVEEKVQSGQFSDADAALNYAVELLRAEDAWFAENAEALRREVAIGIEQLDRGEGEEWDVEEIKAEGRRLLAQRNKERRSRGPQKAN